MSKIRGIVPKRSDAKPSAVQPDQKEKHQGGKIMATYKLLAARRDSTGYHYKRWERATPISVKAETASEAFEKARKALGTPRGVSDSWTFRVTEIVID